MKITRIVGLSLADIQNLIVHQVKQREFRMNTNALAYRSSHFNNTVRVTKRVVEENKAVVSAINECQLSVSKLVLIADFISVAKPQVVEKLIVNNRFDNMTKVEILDELVNSCD